MPIAMASGTSGPDRFDLGGEIEVAVGETVGFVGRERGARLAPTDVDVGMVPILKLSRLRSAA